MKKDFFTWFDDGERMKHEKPSTVWIRNYVTRSAWESYRTGEAKHDGDCTKMPYSCGLCTLTDLLVQYRDYYFDRGEYGKESI